MPITLSVKKNIFSANDALAEKINHELSEKQIYCINVLGGAGAGKTSALISLIKNLKEIKSYVIEGDLASDIDTQTLRNLGVEAYQINTGGQCHLNAPMLQKILQEYPLEKTGILFIENIGNLVCPAEFIIGEHIKLLVCSVPEGSDKPYKYPFIFQKAEAVLLTKSDLKPYIQFDYDYFLKGIRSLNPEAPVFSCSTVTGEGFAEAAAWILNKCKA